MGNNKDFVENFKKFMAFCEEQAPDTLDMRLRAMGLDPDKIGQMGKDLAEKLYREGMKKEKKKIRFKKS